MIHQNLYCLFVTHRTISCFLNHPPAVRAVSAFSSMCSSLQPSSFPSIYPHQSLNSVIQGHSQSKGWSATSARDIPSNHYANTASLNVRVQLIQHPSVNLVPFVQPCPSFSGRSSAYLVEPSIYPLLGDALSCKYRETGDPWGSNYRPDLYEHSYESAADLAPVSRVDPQ
jgi:hypothetical protein